MTPRRPQRPLSSVVGGPLDENEIELSPGLFIEGKRWEATATVQGMKVSFVVSYASGVPECESLAIESRSRSQGTAITGKILRSIPLAHLVELAAGMPDVYRKQDDARVAVTTQDAVDVRKGQPKSKLLPIVVAEYRAALVDPATRKSPTIAVARKLGYERGHISRLLTQARRAGMLGSASPGQAGEAREDQTTESSTTKTPSKEGTQ